MAFNEKLKVTIESIFNSAGFQQLNKQLDQARAKISGMSKMYNAAQKQAGRLKFGREMNERLSRTRFQLEDIDSVIRRVQSGAMDAGDAFAAAGIDITDNFNSVNEAVNAATEQVNTFGGALIEEGEDGTKRLVNQGSVVQALTNQFDDLGAMIRNVPKDFDVADPMQQFRTGDTPSVQASVSFSEQGESVQRSLGQLPDFDAERFSLPQPGGMGNMQRALLNMGLLNEELRGMERRVTYATKAEKMFNSVSGSAAKIVGNDMVPSMQNLQMALLGVQFQLMSLAFIFGGMMGSALGAVGIFQILGNTLKMFFLPIALDLLPLVLDIRDAILGVDDETKRFVGRVFALVAAISGLGSLLAFTVNGFLAFLSPLVAVGSRLLQFVANANSLRAVLGVLKSGFMTVGRVLIGLGSFLYGLVGGFLAATKIIDIFGGTIGGIINVLLALAGIVAVVTGAITAPFWATAAIIGAAIGLIIGTLWHFKDEVMNVAGTLLSVIMTWGGKLLDLLLWPFKKAYEIIVGNSIIPDMVNDIINFLLKLPKKAFNIGKDFINQIVKGIKGVGNKIWNALKKVLPDFIVDAIEGAGKAIGKGVDMAKNAAKGAANAAGNLTSGITSTASNVASGIGNKVDGIFGGGNNNKVQKNVQNNNINANVETNDKAETPEETGWRLSEGLSTGLNNRQNNFANGT